MESLRVFGGTPLNGEFLPQGAKNAVLPMMASALMMDGEIILHQVPDLTDVAAMSEILEGFGCKVKREKDTLTIHTEGIHKNNVDDTLMKAMRASNLIWGPLLCRFGAARIPMPGGCSIGTRPMDLHLKGLKEFGVVIEEHGGAFYSTCQELNGADIYLDFPSVGATENLIAAAVLAKGNTVLRNVAREPEIADFCRFLNQAGAHIWGIGTDCLVIEGVKKLGDVVHTVMPDRIVGGTILLGAALVSGCVKLKGVAADHVESLLAKLHQTGVRVEKEEDGITMTSDGKLHAIDLKTMPFPGFPTDLQAPFTAMLTLAEGTSIVRENIFENRFQYCTELNRMGANISTSGQMGIIQGVPHLEGAKVDAPDLRGGAALVLAAMAARGESEVGHVCYMDRGYCSIESIFNSLGGRIERKTMA